MNSSSVLIIEDDESLLRGLADNFRKHGYRVETARDGATGLAAALGDSFDLILLDIMIPTINGFEVCRDLRAKKCSSIIIMLTARGQEDDIVRGLDLGADDYVTKPFSVRELLARAKAFLRKKGNESQTSYSFGDYVLALDAHQLLRKDDEIPLTSKEFRLLTVLVQRAGRALTRNDILDRVWGSSVIVTSRSVDRCVTTLRGKIESDPAHPKFILTIRDVGYRFDADA